MKVTLTPTCLAYRGGDTLTAILEVLIPTASRKAVARPCLYYSLESGVHGFFARVLACMPWVCRAMLTYRVRKERCFGTLGLFHGPQLQVQVHNASAVTESVSLAVECVGTERIDRNLISASYRPLVPPVESDGRRELREIFRHQPAVVARNATVGPGSIRAWLVTYA